MGHTVLIVEDTPDIRSMMRLMLEFAGYRVLEAANGLEAVEVACEERPDAILIDMSLPVMDGCQATRRIREQPGLRAIPIIACTSYNRWEWRGKAIVAGCTDFLTKPFNSAGLVAVLSRHLKQS